MVRMVSDPIWAAIEAMPREAQLDLAASIVGNAHPDDPPLSAEEFAEVQDAAREYREHPERLVDWEPMMARVRARHQ
jgi:hypothetical protein